MVLFCSLKEWKCLIAHRERRSVLSAAVLEPVWAIEGGTGGIIQHCHVFSKIIFIQINYFMLILIKVRCNAKPWDSSLLHT